MGAFAMSRISQLGHLFAGLSLLAPALAWPASYSTSGMSPGTAATQLPQGATAPATIGTPPLTGAPPINQPGSPQAYAQDSRSPWVPPMPFGGPDMRPFEPGYGAGGYGPGGYGPGGYGPGGFGPSGYGPGGVGPSDYGPGNYGPGSYGPGGFGPGGFGTDRSVSGSAGSGSYGPGGYGPGGYGPGGYGPGDAGPGDIGRGGFGPGSGFQPPSPPDFSQAPGFGGSPGPGERLPLTRSTGPLRFNQTVTAEGYVLEIPLEGLKADQVRVDFDGRALRLSRQTSASQSRADSFDEGRGYQRSFSYSSGRSSRRIPLPPDADGAAMKREDQADKVVILIPRRQG